MAVVGAGVVDGGCTGVDAGVGVTGGVGSGWAVTSTVCNQVSRRELFQKRSHERLSSNMVSPELVAEPVAPHSFCRGGQLV